MAEQIHLVVRRKLWDPGTDDLTIAFTDGKAVGHYLDDAGYLVPPGCSAFVAVAAETRFKILEPEEWDGFVPRPGDLITVNTLPGGGGGGDGKSPLQTLTTIASIALMVAAPGPGSAFAFLSDTAIAGTSITWANVAGFALSALGGLMTQPPKPALSAIGNIGGGMAPSSPTYAIDDAGNQVLKYGQVPRPLGKYRWQPPLGAVSYREVVGKKLFYRVLLVAGYGPLKISNLTLGETPFSEYPNIEVEIHEGWPGDGPRTLFSNDVWGEPMDVLLAQADGWSSRQTLTGTDEATLDFMCPRLAYITGASSRQALTVEIEVDYAAVGTENWAPCVWVDDGEPGLDVAGRITITDNSTAEVWRGVRTIFPAAGQYKIRARRNTTDQTDANKLDEIHWVAMRSVKYTDPINASGMATIALRIEATNELHGQLPPVWATTETYYNIYDPATDTWSYQLSRSPSWATVDAAMGPANPRPKQAADVDLDAFVDFATDCAARGLNCDGVIDYGGTVLDIFNAIAETGWGRYTANGAKVSVVWDRPVAAPTQHFMPHNTISFEREKLLPKRPHALLCHFRNEDAGYEMDVLPVYAAGYNASNATEFEVRQYQLIVSPAQIVKTGRREIAVSLYRDMNCQLKTKMHHLVCRPGHVVSVTRPETGWGLGSGRVKSVSAAQVVLSDAVPMEAGKTYSLAFTYAKKNKPRKTVELLPAGADGEYKTVAFGQLDGNGQWQPWNLPAADWPAQDDFFQFGETGFVARDFLVADIDHREGDIGTLHLAPEGSEVFPFIDGANPPYASPISVSKFIQARPEKPAVRSVTSNEDAALKLTGGIWVDRIRIELEPRPGEPWQLDQLQVRHRTTGASQWIYATPLPASAQLINIEGVLESVDYDIDLRVITSNGLASDWTRIPAHTVIGRSTPPPDPDGLYVEQMPGGGKRYRISGQHARDHAGRLIRWNPGVNLDWASSVAAHTGIHSTDSFEATAFMAATFTVLVKTIDTAGNESAGLAYAVVRQGDRIAGKLVDSVDYQAGNFPGTISGATVNAGELQSDASTALFTDPAQPLFTDPSNVLFDGYDTLVYTAALKPLRKGYMTIEADIDGPYRIEYRASGGDPLFVNPLESLFDNAADPLFGQGQPALIQGPFMVEKGCQYEIIVTIPGGPAKGIIRALEAKIEVPTETEGLEDVAIAAGGTRLQPTRLWDQITRVEITTQEAPGYTAVRAHTQDKLATGPLIQGYNQAGAAAAALVDVTIEGIPTL